MNRFLTVVLFLSVSLSSAATADQTEWSGGPGVQGPVSAFRTTFSSASSIDWSVPGGITLASEVIEHRVDEAFEGAISITAADIDGDGDLDIAGAALDGDEIAWWENTEGDGSVWLRHTVADDFTGASSVVCADLDADGDIDLIGAGKTLYGGHDIVWWENTDGLGTTWTEHAISTAFAGAHAVCVADIDGDGLPDVLGAAIYRDEIAWWGSDTSGTAWEKHIIAEGFDGAWTVHAADMDGDGDQDAVGGAYYADAVAWFENTDGVGATWERHDVDTGFDGVYSVQAFDVDGDGDMDILGAAALGDDVTWWENRQGTFIGHVIDGNCDGAVWAHCVDIDGDGDADVLAASIQDDAIHLYLREETSWTLDILVMSFDGAVAVNAADLDGDGDPDVFGAAMLQNAIFWWDRNPNSGHLESSILDTGTYPIWGLIDWTAQTPEGATVAFQVRASDDPAEMGDWSEPITTPGRLSDVLADSLSFVQYRALLQTARLGSLPVLESVALSWIPVSVGEEGSAPVPPGVLLYPVSPNPTSGAPALRFFLPAEAPAEVMVFDLSGRIVWTEERTALPAGLHEISPGELVPGVYVCRLISGDFEARERFTVSE